MWFGEWSVPVDAGGGQKVEPCGNEAGAARNSRRFCKPWATLALALTLGMAAPLSADDVTLTNSSPEDAAMESAPLESALDLFRGAVDRGEVVGAVLLVARNGRIVLHEALGWRDRERELPMERDTMFRMASNTKAVVATGVAILQEQGKLDYSDLVREYMPSFDNYRAGFIQVEHLLTHTSGMRIATLFLDPLSTPGEQYPDAPTLILEAARFGEVGAEVIPGTSYSYSNPGYNTLGALIELRSGKRLDAFLHDAIYAPLGMKDSYHLETSDHLGAKLSRMGVVYYEKENGRWKPGWTPGDDPISPFPRGSGGLISTAKDFAIFCQMFLNEGIYGGNKILTPESIERMTESHTGIEGEDYGYGWRIEGEMIRHGGSDGTEAWIDRKRGIIGIILTQTPGGGYFLLEAYRSLVNQSADIADRKK